ncbi:MULTISPECIES: hypothetical protein [unclassified Paraburkholderia]|uniref:hypothetical protein n=1 Tax=unclassified Paraburkholderia TaxID=2615204 RepID=UPI00160E41E6|nr:MULTISPECIES: hypothetical protein [unclassified Paraburkholderia]MBB5442144.1 hypothetical protein [Paraburkholderia sp. WSM4177]MBB5483047.1 hypothetical protein [Paraburkholderia sp. WSM4180]
MLKITSPGGGVMSGYTRQTAVKNTLRAGAASRPGRHPKTNIFKFEGTYLFDFIHRSHQITDRKTKQKISNYPEISGKTWQ